MHGGTRDRMIQASVDALSRQGVAGMSFTEVLEASGAARGAIYHHFPGGKGQLVAEAAERFGRDVRAHLAELSGGTPDAFVERFITLVRPIVEASALGGGCAVAAVATGSSGDDGLRQAAQAAFASWADQLAHGLAASGVARQEADGLAQVLLALLEGAHVLCRAAASIEPFDEAARSALMLVRSKYRG